MSPSRNSDDAGLWEQLVVMWVGWSSIRQLSSCSLLSSQIRASICSLATGSEMEIEGEGGGNYAQTPAAGNPPGCCMSGAQAFGAV